MPSLDQGHSRRFNEVSARVDRTHLGSIVDLTDDLSRNPLLQDVPRLKKRNTTDPEACKDVGEWLGRMADRLSNLEAGCFWSSADGSRLGKSVASRLSSLGLSIVHFNNHLADEDERGFYPREDIADIAENGLQLFKQVIRVGLADFRDNPNENTSSVIGLIILRSRDCNEAYLRGGYESDVSRMAGSLCWYPPHTNLTRLADGSVSNVPDIDAMGKILARLGSASRGVISISGFQQLAKHAGLPSNNLPDNMARTLTDVYCGKQVVFEALSTPISAGEMRETMLEVVANRIHSPARRTYGVAMISQGPGGFPAPQKLYDFNNTMAESAGPDNVEIFSLTRGLIEAAGDNRADGADVLVHDDASQLALDAIHIDIKRFGKERLVSIIKATVAKDRTRVDDESQCVLSNQKFRHMFGPVNQFMTEFKLERRLNQRGEFSDTSTLSTPLF